MVLSANDPVAAWGGVKLLRERFGIEPASSPGPPPTTAWAWTSSRSRCSVKAFNAITNGAALGDHLIEHLGLAAKFPAPAAAER